MKTKDEFIEDRAIDILLEQHRIYGPSMFVDEAVQIATEMWNRREHTARKVRSAMQRAQEKA